MYVCHTSVQHSADCCVPCSSDWQLMLQGLHVALMHCHQKAAPISSLFISWAWWVDGRMGSSLKAWCRCEATCWKSAKRNRPQGRVQQGAAHKRQRALAPAGAADCAPVPDSDPQQQPHSTALQAQVAVDRQAVDLVHAW